MVGIDLLEYLLVFLEAGTLLKASERLCISQPSLSKGMQKLEEQLGITIFDRTVNKITLNQAGEEILPYMKDIVEMNKRLLEKAKEIKESENALSIGFTAPGPIYKFPNLFFSSASQFKITTKLEDEKSLLNGLMNNTYDVIFINHEEENDKFICKKVMSERLYVSLPSTHFLSRMKQGVHWSDIDGQSFLLYSYTGIWEDLLNKHLKRSRFLRNSSVDDIREIAEYSTIPSFLTNATIQRNGTERRVNLPILDDDAELDFYVVCKKKNQKILRLLK